MNKIKQFFMRLGKVFKKPLFLAPFLLFILIIAGGVYAGFKFYKKGWEDKTSLIVAKLIPYPAVFINYHPVSIADYRMRGVDFTRKFYNDSKGLDYLKSGEGKLKFMQKKRDFLDIVIEEEFIREYAGAQHLAVKDPELEDAYKKLLVENGGQAVFERSLHDDYQWSTKYFKRLLSTNLLREKINQKLCSLDSKDAKARAEDIKKKVIAGAPFDELAMSSSDDQATAVVGGKLPPFTKDGLTESNEVMDRAIVDFANRANKGEVDIVKTCHGYSVARLDTKDGDARGVSHILAKIKSYEDLLSEFRERSRITILLPEFYFNNDQKAVFPRK